MDASSIMHDQAQNFFNIIAPILIDLSKQIIIPLKVAQYIEHLQSSPKSKTKKAAQNGMKILNHYIARKLVSIRSEKNDPSIDFIFHHIFLMLMTKYDLALVTQDKRCAMNILDLINTKTIITNKKLLVLKFGNSGGLLIWKNAKPFNSTQRSHSISTKKFRLCTKPRSQKDNIIRVQKIPKKGDFVKADEFGQIRLKHLIGKGGEGKIFSTNSDYACKIYFKERITENRFKKLILMAGRKIKIPGVCWPLALARNSHNEFIGYLMPFAEGKPMQKCMFVKPLLEKNFHHWSRKNLVQVSITWLEKVIELHKYNIFIGDINPLNFIVKSDCDLSFVDTDSYQIEDFPCPVGMANFTAPEIQKTDYAKFLRTAEHEYFAIATLLFMILLPGKPPFSHQGGGDPLKNIRKGQFSYPLGEKSSKKTPDGPWRFIWSHLPFKTKEAFFNCFVNQKRITPVQWLDLMKSYKFSLELGYLDPDGESDKLFPTRFKGVSSFAKERYGAEKSDWITFKCDNCGNTFQLNSDKVSKVKNVPQKLCRDCFQVQMKKGEKLVCVDCYETFLFSINDKKFYDQKGFNKPKRCKQCRTNRKNSESSTGSFQYNSYSNRTASIFDDPLWSTRINNK